ncbi:SVWC domain-containing protein [Caerostris darwini]|uniref:SVWC domain-containing protein n=1 Tax=Caerostris darwini TaxID=1538125 RepID=A0AAV4TRX1_9ARAC|nr:SVWC domain-containing protein [Caerostris darwini]
MSPFALIASLLVMLVVCTEGYVYRGKTDTSSGFCETDKFGDVPVNGEGYNDDTCERMLCSNGMYQVQGCGITALDEEGCHLEAGEGHYPDCCKTHVVCDDDDDDEN